MSNLGLYQTMTTCAKKVGGPLNLLIIVGVGGHTSIRLCEAGITKVIKTVKKYSQKNKTAPRKAYVVNSNCKSIEGLIFNAGDKYHILDIDKDAVLIEKIGDNNNPYFVSADLLRSISNFDH